MSPSYRLFEAHFDDVRGQWEERFERRCGFWRGFVDERVRRYLDWMGMGAMGATLHIHALFKAWRISV